MILVIKINSLLTLPRKRFSFPLKMPGYLHVPSFLGLPQYIEKWPIIMEEMYKNSKCPKAH